MISYVIPKAQRFQVTIPLTPALSPNGGEGDSAGLGSRQVQAASASPVISLAPIGGEGRGEGDAHGTMP